MAIGIEACPWAGYRMTCSIPIAMAWALHTMHGCAHRPASDSQILEPRDGYRDRSMSLGWLQDDMLNSDSHGLGFAHHAWLCKSTSLRFSNPRAQGWL